jgi:RHS repeat-associated protein
MFDEQGKQVWASEINIYGELIHVKGQKSLCPFRWPGQYEDEETGLYYNRYRYYDPDSGIYISQDPAGLRGGLGLYAYTTDVLSSTDPFGLTPLPVLIGETGARLRRAAQEIGAEWIGPAWNAHGGLWPVTAENFAEGMNFNREWINRMMDEGRLIIDIGRDPRRIAGGQPMSSFYQLELDEIAKRDYQNFQSLEEYKATCG